MGIGEILAVPFPSPARPCGQGRFHDLGAPSAGLIRPIRRPVSPEVAERLEQREKKEAGACGLKKAGLL